MKNTQYLIKLSNDEKVIVDLAQAGFIGPAGEKTHVYPIGCVSADGKYINYYEINARIDMVLDHISSGIPKGLGSRPFNVDGSLHSKPTNNRNY